MWASFQAAKGQRLGLMLELVQYLPVPLVRGEEVVTYQFPPILERRYGAIERGRVEVLAHLGADGLELWVTLAEVSVL